MRVIAVDDECNALDAIAQEFRKIPEISEVHLFDDPEQALAYTEKYRVDIAFLDIEMYGMTGLELAKTFKQGSPHTNIIFVTGFADYAVDAFALAASGYLLKPVTETAIRASLEQLRNPVNPKTSSPVYIQCFGNFDVFVSGRIISFTPAKSKEALAYLIDRKGAGVSKKELAAVLLEDKQYTRGIQSYIHRIITGMIGTLEKAGAGDMVIKDRNLYAVDITKFSCDYYDYEKGVVSAINSYRGEYMVNYSWAEFTNALL